MPKAVRKNRGGGDGTLCDRIQVYSNDDVLYLPQYQFPICQGFVPEEAINHPYHLDRLNIRDISIAEYAVSHDEVCILGNIHSQVFGHWVEELLKVVALEDFGFDGYYVAAAGFPDFCFESMDLLGISRNRFRLIDKATVFSKAFFITNVCHWNAHRFPEVIRLLRDQLHDAVGPGSLETERVWADRGRGCHADRAPVNQEEIDACLVKHGFEKVDLAAYSFRRQIQFAKNMRVLAGIHGSAMVHCGFMQDSGHVIEMFSPLFINPSIIELCLVLGHRYNQMVYDNVYDRSYSHGYRVMVDTNHLEVILSTLSNNQQPTA